MRGGMNLETQPSRETATSMIVSGSTVAVVGGILIATKTWAFSAMLAFGIIVAVVGVVIARRQSKAKHEPEVQSQTDT